MPFMWHEVFMRKDYLEAHQEWGLPISEGAEVCSP